MKIRSRLKCVSLRYWNECENAYMLTGKAKVTSSECHCNLRHCNFTSEKEILDALLNAPFAYLMIHELFFVDKYYLMMCELF